MSALSDKLRRAREFSVEADGVAFTALRPTDIDAQRLRGMDTLDAVCRFVVGWDMTELALGVPGGSNVAVEFDADALREWLSDRIDAINVLAAAIMESYVAHAQKKAAAEKN